MAVKVAGFKKAVDDTSALRANVGNKMLALKIDLRPFPYTLLNRFMQ